LALGHVLGIPAFLTDKSIEDDAQVDRQIQLAKNSNSATKGEIEANVLALQNQATDTIQRLWEGRLIRQTIASKNEKGEAIINLLPYTTIVGLLKLQQWEHDIIEEIAVRAGSKYTFELCRLCPGLPLETGPQQPIPLKNLRQEASIWITALLSDTQIERSSSETWRSGERRRGQSSTHAHRYAGIT
jgi:hypothetical protein